MEDLAGRLLGTDVLWVDFEWPVRCNLGCCLSVVGSGSPSPSGTVSPSGSDSLSPGVVLSIRMSPLIADIFQGMPILTDSLDTELFLDHRDSVFLVPKTQQQMFPLLGQALL